MSGNGAYARIAFLAGVVFLFMIGCTPGSSSDSSSAGSSGSSSAAGAATLVAHNSNPADPSSDPLDGSGTNPIASDPSGDPLASGSGPDPVGGGTAIPEPATGLLFACAVGSIALARLRARRSA
jgi:hypothetical protein